MAPALFREKPHIRRRHFEDTYNFVAIGETTMSPEKLDAVTGELKRFAQSLNLSEAQKEQLRTFLAEKHAKIQEFKQRNPNLSRQSLIQTITSIRGSLREQVVKFLNPSQ